MSSHRQIQNEDNDQLLVETPFGRGLVVRRRSNDNPSSTKHEAIKEIRLLDWSQADSTRNNGRKGPMLYTTNDYNSVAPKKGDDVITPYGRGVVEEIVVIKISKKKVQTSNNNCKSVNNCGASLNGQESQKDKIDHKSNDRLLKKYRVSLTSWRLAGRSRVKCFLLSSQVKVVRTKILYEMNALERIDYAMGHKQIASKLFSQKKYGDALTLYAQAVEAVRYIQHTQSTSNEYRADLLVVIVTCSNNAATCCIHLEKFDEAGKFAKNALILLNALYNKREMKIHGVLMKDSQLSDAKIFGEWRGKSCLIIARSESKHDNISEALGRLLKAKEYILEFKNTEENDNTEQKRLKDLLKEILKLKGILIERRKHIREKEKARAQAMFSEKSADKKDLNDKNIHTNEGKEDSSKEKTHQDQPITTHAKLNKRVSFAKKLEDRLDVDVKEIDERDSPWYEEHKEALVLLAVGGIVCLTTALGLRKK